MRNAFGRRQVGRSPFSAHAVSLICAVPVVSLAVDCRVDIDALAGRRFEI